MRGPIRTSSLVFGLVAVSVASAQSSESPGAVGRAGFAKAMREARTVATIDGWSGQVATAPDGSAVAVIDHERKAACIFDAKSGKVVPAPRAGEVASIALLPGARGCWLGLHDGSIVHCPRGGEARHFPGVASGMVDGILCVGGQVAWSSSGADYGGVLDARDGSILFGADAPLGGYRKSRMLLTRDGRHVVNLMPSPSRGGRRVAIVRDARSGKEQGTANCYLSKNAGAVAFGVDSIYSAARVGRGWQLQRLDLVTFEREVVDDELRGKHFVDLFLSPSSRYLLEGDFEDSCVVLYRLAPGGAHKQELAKGALPLGFLATESGEELAITSNEGSRLGLCAWSTQTGELVATLPVGEGKRVTRVGPLLGGRGMWFSWWSSKSGKAIQRHLECVRFDS